MYCVSTLLNHVLHRRLKDFKYQKGIVGAAAEQLSIDASACNGTVSGYQDFSGSHLYTVVDGVCFNTIEDQQKFCQLYGHTYNAEVISDDLVPGIKSF